MNMHVHGHLPIVPTVISACLLLFGLALSIPLTDDQSPEQAVRDDDKAGTKSYLILMWYWPWGFTFNLEGGYCYDNFDIPNCILTANQSLFSEADVVIFHNFELSRGYQRLPVHLKRPEKQRWVWYSMAPPDFSRSMKDFAGHFNWTMTYYRNADIYAPYGHMVARDPISEEPVQNFIPKRKTHLACWMVSNLKADHYRTAVYNKLKTVIPVEVYGVSVGRRIMCQDMLPLLSHCYFYLAFEGAVCKDYITEKLWYNAYMSGAVPVVLGPSREDYEAVAPKDSFIHVNDFGSIEELGEFLKTLAKDKERYASYFNWRLKYTIENEKSWAEYMCKFCPKISSMPPYKVYEDLDAWLRQ